MRELWAKYIFQHYRDSVWDRKIVRQYEWEDLPDRLKTAYYEAAERDLDYLSEQGFGVMREKEFRIFNTAPSGEEMEGPPFRYKDG